MADQAVQRLKLKLQEVHLTLEMLGEVVVVAAKRMAKMTRALEEINDLIGKNHLLHGDSGWPIKPKD